jgi:hypothetical protein
MQTVEAILETNGSVRLLKPFPIKGPRRVIVTILEEPVLQETALLSEASLARDWNRPEEDEAWSYLQTGK